MNPNEYTASSIKVLEGLEAVRKRPAMYIGSTGPKGLHHLIFEVLDNSVDEALAGYCDKIEVVLHKDGSCSVIDNGRGIPVDIHKDYGISALELVLTKLHAGGKFDTKTYKISGGLHGVGVSVVNALSEWLEAKVKRDGRIYFMRFERGKPVTSLKVLGETKETGTEIRFKPDKEIFETVVFDSKRVLSRINELAYLNPNVLFVFRDERTNLEKKIQYKGGISQLVMELASTKGKIIQKQPLHFLGEEKDIFVEISLIYTDSLSEEIMSFVNCINTTEGGTHVMGFKRGLAKAVKDFVQKEKKSLQLQPEDARLGVCAVINVRIPQPQFESQTKIKLGNTEVIGIVQQITYKNVLEFLHKNVDDAKNILKKIEENVKIRVATKKARELVKRKSAFSSFDLPGKLADCTTKDKEKAELFIVEGDSAGGSAKSARIRSFQAILPLRGKILNVEKANINRILLNNEIRALISAIGTGIKEEYDEKKLRYGKIIIMTDADVDGAHIRTLLLTFFYRFMKPLIENEHVFIVQPPLYRIQKGKNIYYAYTDKEKDELVKRLGKDVVVQRFKGLGEMDPKQLWETTMDPEKRILKKVTIEDAIEAEKLFNILMGQRVDKRREFIQKHAKEVTNIDV